MTIKLALNSELFSAFVLHFLGEVVTFKGKQLHNEHLKAYKDRLR